MFEGFSDRTFDFIWGLRFNNNKAWFTEHKNEFIEDFQTPMKELGLTVFDEINSRFGGRGFIHKLSRIYKDARRLKGGDPYRTNLWFSIERPSEEWTSTPVFWFELDAESWSYGMGYYQARPNTMAKLRARIDKNPKAFEKLIVPFEKQGEFVLDGEEYVRKKEAPTAKTANWYNKKSFSLVHNQPNGDELFSPELAARLIEGFASLMPIYDYIITLDSDPEPAKGN